MSGMTDKVMITLYDYSHGIDFMLILIKCMMMSAGVNMKLSHHTLNVSALMQLEVSRFIHVID